MVRKGFLRNWDLVLDRLRDFLANVLNQVGDKSIGLKRVDDNFVWMRGGIPLAERSMHDVVDVLADDTGAAADLSALRIPLARR